MKYNLGYFDTNKDKTNFATNHFMDFWLNDAEPSAFNRRFPEGITVESTLNYSRRREQISIEYNRFVLGTNEYVSHKNDKNQWTLEFAFETNTPFLLKIRRGKSEHLYGYMMVQQVSKTMNGASQYTLQYL